MAVTPSRPPLQPAAQFEPGVLFRLLDDVAAYKQRYEEITATAAKLQKQSDDLHAERVALDKAKEEHDARDADLAKREAAAKAAEEAIVKKRGDALALNHPGHPAGRAQRSRSLRNPGNCGAFLLPERLEAFPWRRNPYISTIQKAAVKALTFLYPLKSRGGYTKVNARR